MLVLLFFISCTRARPVQDAVDCATQALEKYNIEKDVAAYIKKEFDKKYNPTWYASVSASFFVCARSVGSAIVFIIAPRQSRVQVHYIHASCMPLRFAVHHLQALHRGPQLWLVCHTRDQALHLFLSRYVHAHHAAFDDCWHHRFCFSVSLFYLFGVQCVRTL